MALPSERFKVQGSNVQRPPQLGTLNTEPGAGRLEVAAVQVAQQRANMFGKKCGRVTVEGYGKRGPFRE